MDALKVNLRKRSSVKQRLTNLVKFVESVAETSILTDKQLKELEIRVASFDRLQNDFEQIQTAIEISCDDEELSQNLEYRDEFTNTLSALQATACTLLDATKLNLDSLNISNTSNLPNNSNQVKLPTIELPKFVGDYKQWLEFKDTFVSLIHENPQINNIQKFHYLRASLSQNVLKIIQSLEFSSDNYEKAWDLLCKRYNKTQLLVHSHLKAIFELESITRETAIGLRSIIDAVSEHLYALKSLKQPTEYWDQILIYIITNKLDRATLREWDHFKSTEEFPNFQEFLKFLINRADALEAFESNHVKPKELKDNRFNNKKVALVTSTRLTCNYCKDSHAIYHCSEFLKLSVSNRIQKVTDLNLCKNCLCRGHDSKRCRSGTCKECKLKHNTLLHINPTTEEKNSSNSNSQISLSACSIDKFVLLSTALIKTGNPSGPMESARALLDSGSQINFISAKLCKQLNLKQLKADIHVMGINKTTSNLTKRCEVTISALNGDSKYTITCYILPKITDNLPAQTIDINSWNIPESIILADPDFNKSGEIELLLGADIFWNVIYDQTHKLSKGLPTLRNTAFGWIACGSFNHPTRRALCNFTMTDSLHEDIKQFWEIEEVNALAIQTTDEAYCEQHFTSNVTRASDGRFMVKIPLKFCPTLLGNSQEQALSRLKNLERKLESSPSLKSHYVSFLEEYQELGHMTLLAQHDESLPSFYLPHHAVLKHDSITTKVRVVFDGSAPSSTGWSLNDLQHTGPTIINDMFQILLRIRQFQFVVMADVAKMYRQIWVHPDDRRLQKILWRTRTDQEPQVYTLNTVTYGTSSAPFLAIRCLQQAAQENQHKFPEASKVILNDFYVDDLITGFNSEQQAIHICTQVSNILSEYHFILRKWHSNSYNITNQLICEEEPLSELPLGNETIKTLGIHWNSQLDTFTYKSIEIRSSKPITKRYVLSCISKIFDPLGLISPCVVTTKIMIQKLWSCKLNWDDPIPPELLRDWLTLCNNLQLVEKISIPRQVFGHNGMCIELVGFCDASKDAYACCIYARSVDKFNDITVQLLCAKTKVAPLKVLTIPRLELLSAVLLAELMTRVSKILTVKHQVSYWSDSKIVLAWLKKDPRHLLTFVSNRVAKIQELTDTSKWYHIPSTDNPADIASRGATIQTLLTAQMWWHGAAFLSLPKNEWSFSINDDLPNSVPETKKNCTSLVNIKQESFPFHNYSNYYKLRRIIAYCIRFVRNIKTSKSQRKLGPLDANELQNATHTLVKWAQEDSFSNEIATITAKSKINIKCNLSALSPFLDENGLLRVGGRLTNSNLPYSVNHPLLLSGRHYFTRIILEAEHKRLLHSGPHQLLSHIRQQFWPTSGLQIAKRVIRNCINCFKFKPKVQFPMMGNLPKERITASHAFNNTGVDLAGPFLLKDRKGRGCKLYKAWICLFICLSTKAIHIELVTSLSTDAFIAGFKRFISRRGQPSRMWSDNGTNFIGASKQLKHFVKNANSDITNFCANEGVQWNFNPPHSPHFGGLWESGIKSVKRHLYKVIGSTHLTYEEFITVLVQIEATVNSRPLFPLSTDPHDLSPLTPAHFLIGRALTTLPESQLANIPMNRLTRFQLLQQLYQSFWSRWSKEYLHHLQQRTKWRNPAPSTTKGTLVLLKEDNLPPCQWMLGRIQELHPGSDGVTRVVTIKTIKGLLKRPVVKICPLPIYDVVEPAGVTE